MSPMGLIKSFVATSAIAKRRIIALGAADGEVVQATSDAGLIGVSGIRGAKIGETVDVYLSDVHPITFGGLVTSGDFVTADAEGRAIKADPAPGETLFVIGRALETGPENAIGNVLIHPQQITG